MRTVFGRRCRMWGEMITLGRNRDSSRSHYARRSARAGPGPAFSCSPSLPRQPLARNLRAAVELRPGLQAPKLKHFCRPDTQRAASALARPAPPAPRSPLLAQRSSCCEMVGISRATRAHAFTRTHARTQTRIPPPTPPARVHEPGRFPFVLAWQNGHSCLRSPLPSPLSFRAPLASPTVSLSATLIAPSLFPPGRRWGRGDAPRALRVLETARTAGLASGLRPVCFPFAP